MKNFLLILVSIIITLGIGELGLMIFYPVDFKKPAPKVENSFKNGFHQKSEVPGLLYEASPNAIGIATGVDVTINSFGMRDKERPLKKPKNTKRIAVIGDSFVYGYGVIQEKIFTNALERFLNNPDNNFPHRFEVLNFGIGGYCITDYLAVLKHKVPMWDPDIVVLSYFMNDVELESDQPMNVYYRPIKWWQHLNMTRLFARSIKKIKDSGRDPTGYYRFLYSEKGSDWIGTAATLAAINEERKGKPYKFLYMQISDIPWAQDWNNREVVRRCEEQVLAEARKNDFEIIDTYPTFSKHNPISIRNSERDGHTNAMGHYLMADLLFQAISKEYQ